VTTPEEDHNRRMEFARNWLNDLVAQQDYAETENASAWIVNTYDRDIDRHYFNGPFLNMVEAFEWADTHNESVNRNLGEHDTPWEVTVYPVYPVEP